MVKEEIKAFLGNRRISQAVVAQVTGECTHSETKGNVILSVVPVFSLLN